MTTQETKIAGSLYGMFVGDALAMPGHWFYSPQKLRADYGELQGMMAPHKTHAESMVQGMSYKGSIDILHDKAHLYEGNTVVSSGNNKLTPKEVEARRDDHGNFVGAVADERIHYHASLKKGQNTANSCIARLLVRYLGSGKKYDPDEFLEQLQTYMTTPPDSSDDAQLFSHNDTYLDVYLRSFFANASAGRRLRDCALSQRDSWSIGSLDGVLIAIPLIAAYSHEGPAMVLGRVVEHSQLTHRSITVTAVLAVLVPLLLELYKGGSSTELRPALDRAMAQCRPPKITGRELADSYVNNHGPGNIPRDEKWKQHMEVAVNDKTTYDLVHGMLECDDEDFAGWRDRPSSRISTACYCEHAFTIVLYLAYKYARDPRKALLQNVMLGGHSTARGAVLGAILGAAYGADKLPFVQDLCAKDAIDTEIDNLLSTKRRGLI